MIDLLLAPDKSPDPRAGAPGQSFQLVFHLPAKYSNDGHVAMDYDPPTHDSADCSTANYNPLFVNYASSCNDCTNYASQVVWYGFGGINDENNIQSHNLPMIQSWFGATNWYGDSYTTSATWSAFDNLRNMILDNYYNNKPGVHGYEVSTSGVDLGDVLFWWNGLGDKHAMVTTFINDYDHDGITQYDEIYYSGHTLNRRDRWLWAELPESQVHPMHINLWQSP